MDQTQHLSTQLERMERLVDADSGAIRYGPRAPTGTTTTPSVRR